LDIDFDVVDSGSSEEYQEGVPGMDVAVAVALSKAAALKEILG
jgi:hypothetical protein